jgi:hypothetical protein
MGERMGRQGADIKAYSHSETHTRTHTHTHTHTYTHAHTQTNIHTPHTQTHPHPPSPTHTPGTCCAAWRKGTSPRRSPCSLWRERRSRRNYVMPQSGQHNTKQSQHAVSDRRRRTPTISTQTRSSQQIAARARAHKHHRRSPHDTEHTHTQPGGSTYTLTGSAKKSGRSQGGVVFTLPRPLPPLRGMVQPPSPLEYSRPKFCRHSRSRKRRIWRDTFTTAPPISPSTRSVPSKRTASSVSRSPIMEPVEEGEDACSTRRSREAAGGNSNSRREAAASASSAASAQRCCCCCCCCCGQRPAWVHQRKIGQPGTGVTSRRTVVDVGAADDHGAIIDDHQLGVYVDLGGGCKLAPYWVALPLLQRQEQHVPAQEQDEPKLQQPHQNYKCQPIG